MKKRKPFALPEKVWLGMRWWKLRWLPPGTQLWIREGDAPAEVNVRIEQIDETITVCGLIPPSEPNFHTMMGTAANTICGVYKKDYFSAIGRATAAAKGPSGHRLVNNIGIAELWEGPAGQEYTLCGVCRKRYIYNASLERHLQNVHGYDATAIEATIERWSLFRNYIEKGGAKQQSDEGRAAA